MNAHNILLDMNDAVSVIDFDRGRLREPGAWTLRNLARLHRSLEKVSRASDARFTPAAWDSLMAGYLKAG